MFEDLQASTQKANMPNNNIQKICVYIYIHGRQTKVAKEDELEEEEPPEQDERQHQKTYDREPCFATTLRAKIKIIKFLSRRCH